MAGYVGPGVWLAAYIRLIVSLVKQVVDAWNVNRFRTGDNKTHDNRANADNNHLR